MNFVHVYKLYQDLLWRQICVYSSKHNLSWMTLFFYSSKWRLTRSSRSFSTSLTKAKTVSNTAPLLIDRSDGWWSRQKYRHANSCLNAFLRPFIPQKHTVYMSVSVFWGTSEHCNKIIECILKQINKEIKNKSIMLLLLLLE